MKSKKNFPAEHHLKALNIDPKQIKRAEILRQKWGHAVYRLLLEKQHYVLKTFDFDVDMREIKLYKLLDDAGVPVLQVHGQSSHAILLEDLEYSDEWRLANQSDSENLEVWRALGAWYKQLHTASFLYYYVNGKYPLYLNHWAEALTQDLLIDAGEKFSLMDTEYWKLAIKHIDALRITQLSFPTVFNYADFAFENLALSRSEPIRAIVFDYDFFALGARYNDVRNVTYQASEEAKQAFREVYGPTEQREIILDHALSPIEGVVIAADREKTPGWAKTILDDIRSDQLNKYLQDAINLVG